MKTAHFLRLDATTYQDLSAGELSYTTSFAQKFKLEGVYIKFSQAVSEAITITLDAAAGTAYDTVLRSRTLSSETNFVFMPEGEANYQAGDNIKVHITNANGVGIAYATIKTSEM